MEAFSICLAGLPISIQTSYSLTKELCADYLTDAPPAFSVAVSDADIVREQEYSIREAIMEGLQPIRYTEDYLESIAVYRAIAEQLPSYQAAVFHSAVIAVDGAAYLFTAKSGTGKTTHIRLWQELFGDRAQVVNGDKPIVRLIDSKLFACGTPWSGKEEMHTNQMVPIRGISILERDTVNHIEKIPASSALPILMQQIYRPRDTQSMRLTVQLLSQILSLNCIYCLGCNMDIEAARVAYEGMKP